MKVNELLTPALVLDKKVFEENMDTMDRLLADTHMQLRPHYKSHKCRDIAKIQMKRGACGITCAKLGEAVDLVKAGIGDIFIANQIVQPEKVKMAAELAESCRLMVCVDDKENIKALSEAAADRGVHIYCMIEFEVGMNRCGVASFEEVLELARLIESLPGIHFDGIQAYAGNLAHEHSLSRRNEQTAVIESTVGRLKEYLEKHDLMVREIGGCSTGTVEQRPKDSVYTHLQTGSYIFMDQAYSHLHLNFKNALYILTTVISTKKDRFITDTGVKSLGMDQGGPILVGVPADTKVDWSEEHGTIYLENHGRRINDKFAYIPGHCCTTVNIFDRLYVVDGDEVVDTWDITARGRSW